MQKFEYRTPRFPVDFPIQLTVKDATLTARCKEISQQGITLELPPSLPTNSSGVVSMPHRDGTIHLNVRVAHVGDTHSGLEFIYGSDTERERSEERRVGKVIR